jgi:hypothetical protein
MLDFDLSRYMIPFTTLNATLAGLAFAAIAFLLRAPLPDDTPE